jgi:signal transduction histidine kinase
MSARRDELERLVAERTEEIRTLNEVLERRVAERTTQLTDMVRELESFAYTIAHDLKAPLRAINGFAALLEKDHGSQLGEEGSGYLAKVRQGAVMMGQLITDLLEYSKLDRCEMKQESLDLDRLSRSVASRAAEIRATGAVVRVALGGARATADPTGLELGVRHLLDNALKFHLPGKVAEVTLTTSWRKTPLPCATRGSADMKYHDRIRDLPAPRPRGGFPRHGGRPGPGPPSRAEDGGECQG